MCKQPVTVATRDGAQPRDQAPSKAHKVNLKGHEIIINKRSRRIEVLSNINGYTEDST